MISIANHYQPYHPGPSGTLAIALHYHPGPSGTLAIALHYHPGPSGHPSYPLRFASWQEGFVD